MSARNDDNADKKIAYVDKLLAKWPIEDRSALDWDEAAGNVEILIARSAKSDETGEMSTYMTDEEIFSPPAGQTDKDGHNSAHSEPGRVLTTAKVPSKVPAAKTQNEDSKMSMSSEQRDRDRKSLQDLARLAAAPTSGWNVTPPPPSVSNVPQPTASKPAHAQNDVMIPQTRAEDSGLVNLAALSAPPPSVAPVSSEPAPQSMRSEQVRQSVNQMQAAPLAQAGLFDDEPASMRPSAAPPSSHQSHPPVSGHMPVGHQSVPPQLVGTLPSGGVPSVHPSAHPQAVQAVPSIQPAQDKAKKKGGGIVIAFGAVVALAAVASVGFFVVKPRLMKSAQPVAAVQPVAPVQTEAAPSATTRWQDQIAANTPPAPATGTTPAQDDMTVDPVPAPATPDPIKKSTASFSAKKPSAKDAPPAAKDNKLAGQLAQQDDKAPPPAPPPPVDPGTAKTASKDGTTATGDALTQAMGKSVGPIDSTPMQTADDKKPQFAPGTVPQRPSQGAVTGAIGAALPNARACLGADDPVSRATIVFSSDGSVTSVSVHGAAQGKPAEQCIKGALSKAKVPPFAEATYTANVTVRH